MATGSSTSQNPKFQDQSIAVAPGLRNTLAAHAMYKAPAGLGRRNLLICLLAIVIGLVSSLVSKLLLDLIGLITNVMFYGKFDWHFDIYQPIENHLGLWIIAMPVIGGLIVGVMARWGASAIRGHGIPEAMEQILLNESRIPPRMTFLKPISSAVTIGSGGPFGAEGPVIATGGAFGSLAGQLLKVTAVERKTLLAAGAAAGMAAFFSAPVSSVLLAIELLLFELRGRSLVPVTLAVVAATGLRFVLIGPGPVFPMPDVAPATTPALLFYAFLSIAVAVFSVGVTRFFYFLEDTFEKLPIHWMWWPAIGGLVVGIIGYYQPQTLGVGYNLIEDIINLGANHMTLTTVAVLGGLKLISWSVALASGTSGGTLAPLFIIGGSLGGCLGLLFNHWFPGLGINPGVAGLLGMAVMLAGAARVMLTAAVFALEVTHQPYAMLPLLLACGVAYLVSSLLMRTTIMTEKLDRRGVNVPDEFHADPNESIHVSDVFSRNLLTLSGGQTLSEVRAWLLSGIPDAQFQGFPVLDRNGKLLGLVTRRTLLALEHRPEDTVAALIKRPPVTVSTSDTLRTAIAVMVHNNTDRVLVVDDSQQLAGVLTSSDILKVHQQQLRQQEERRRHLRFRNQP
jgi:H+/Cl- antiporter ClcA/CBS domain-containing protein